MKSLFHDVSRQLSFRSQLQKTLLTAGATSLLIGVSIYASQNAWSPVLASWLQNKAVKQNVNQLTQDTITHLSEQEKVVKDVSKIFGDSVEQVLRDPKTQILVEEIVLKVLESPRVQQKSQEFAWSTIKSCFVGQKQQQSSQSKTKE